MNNWLLGRFLSFCILFLTFFTFGQFEGGDGSGMNVHQINNQSCISYYGSDASGFHVVEVVSSPCNSFYGDSLSGYYNDDLLLSDCHLFEGGENSGHDLTHFVHPETCVMFTESSNAGSGYYAQSITEENNPCALIALGVNGSPLFGEILDHKGILKWQTFSERNNQGFEIMKSLDGEDWNQIGWIDGRGNSSETIAYEFKDDDLKMEGQYYRFKQVDFGGFETLSNVVYLKPNEATTNTDVFVLYPNPSERGSAIYLKAWIVGEWTIDMEILDMAGRIISTDQVVFYDSSSPYILNTDGLPIGTYFLFLKNEERNLFKKIAFVIV